MATIIKGNIIYNCGGGIRVPSEGDVEVLENNIRNTGIAIDIYDNKVWADIGVPKEADPRQVTQVIDQLKKSPNASNEEKSQIVMSSGLAKWLTNAELATKVIAGLIALAKAGSELFK